MIKDQLQPSSPPENKLIRHGDALIEEFFKDIIEDKLVDNRISKVLKDLYNHKELSKDKILQKLSELRSPKNG